MLGLVIASLLIIGFGVFIIFKSTLVAEKLKRFYSRYPLVRYAGEKQLSSRNSYVVALGIVIVLVGIVCLVSTFSK